MSAMNQVAMSVCDLRRTHAWYSHVFGFVPAGGTNAFKGFIAQSVQGVPGAASTCWWLMDGREFFQLELFEFYRPATRPLPADWRLCDIGYGMVGLAVDDFDAVMARLQDAGKDTLGPSVGDVGQRRACVRDPEGVLLQIMEDDPLAGIAPRAPSPVTVRSVTLSVADLEAARRFFGDTLELDAFDGTLHTPEHGDLWGLPGAQRRELVLRAGGVLLEIVQYQEPQGRQLPPDYRISDQGLLNIALGFRSRREFERVHRKCVDAGYRPNWRPLRLGAWSVVYVNDDQGCSVELLHVAPWYDGRMGFRPGQPPAYRARGGLPRWRTAIVTGGCSGIGRELARRLLAAGTAVAIIDRNISGDARAALEQAGPGRAVFLVADVTARDQLAAAVGGAVDELGAPDLAINCAGIQNAKPFATLTGEEFDTVVSVNLCGSRNLAAAVLPHMGSGAQLALVASLAGLLPSHSYAAYNASKYGVVGLAGALRLECVERGIEVSVICPPEVNTPMVVTERRTLPPVAARLKDTAGTLEVGPCCEYILAQLTRRRFLIIPGRRARWVARIARWCPGLLRRISERIVLAGSAGR